jgi:DNA polymerase III delta prime subunit
MVNLHTRLPHYNAKGPTGEYIAAMWVDDNLDESWHAWFQVNWLANVREMDQILAHPKHGVFVIEVKGHKIGEIAEFSPNDGKFTDGQKGNPNVQAHRAKQQLASWLKQRSDTGQRQVPWLESTSWFPRVNILEFQAKFPHPDVDKQADSMIFADDMKPVEFLAALRSARSNPPIGAAAKFHPNDFAQRVTWMIEELDASLVTDTPTPTVQPPKQPKKSAVDTIAVRATEYSKPDHTNVVFAGGPGTGKTSTLLAIGRERARRGERVLYLTYNKVLAANVRAQLRDMSREDQVNGFGPPEGWNVIGLDLWDFYRRVTDKPLPLKMTTARYTRWERKYGRMLKRAVRKGLEKFDAILVDEIQDVTDVGLEYVFAAAKEATALYAGYGYGQALYRGESGQKLTEWLETAERLELERSYRASKPAHLVIKAFIEHGTDAETAVNEIEGLSMEDKMLILAGEPRKRGNADSDKSPGNIRLKNRDGATVDSNIYVWELHEFLREVRKPDGTYDAMILMRRVSNTVAEACRQALRGGEIPFVDLLDEKNRRNATPEGHVKLVTMNSSRGLSAANVLVIGFDDIKGDGQGANLASVALSRATEQTVVVCATDSTSPSVLMLRKVLDAAVRAKQRPE